MKKSKWPDFIVTIIFRFIGGAVLGAGAIMVFGYRGILRAFSRNHTKSPLILLAISALVGGIISVCKTPYWQTPWYKRDREFDSEVAKAFLHKRQ
jgi:hypothetical protein